MVIAKPIFSQCKNLKFFFFEIETPALIRCNESVTVNGTVSSEFNCSITNVYRHITFHYKSIKSLINE